MEFLELYEKEPAIWNLRDPQRKIRNYVNELQRIAVQIANLDFHRYRPLLYIKYSNNK